MVQRNIGVTRKVCEGNVISKKGKRNGTTAKRVVVGGEESATIDRRDDVVQYSMGDRQSIKCGCSSPEFVQHQHGILGCLSKHYRSLLHLNHECGLVLCVRVESATRKVGGRGSVFMFVPA